MHTSQNLTADRVTKSLLGYGVIAGPIYVVTSLAQALLRDGFDLSRHAWPGSRPACCPPSPRRTGWPRCWS